MRRRGRESFWSRAAWLAAEAVVVFVGVYAAFWLDGYRAEQRTEERRQQIYQALHEEISEVNTDIKRQLPAVDTVFTGPFLEAYEAGERPMPEPLLYSSRGLDTRTWEAMLQSGGLDALDVAFIREVDDFYGSLDYAVRTSEEYRALSDALILPRSGEGTATFYEAGAKQLKAPYQWYPNALRSIASMMKNMQRKADSLQMKLEARMEETNPAPAAQAAGVNR